MIYTMALILQSAFNIDFWISIIIIGLITMIYSFQGGMKAVIWRRDTDDYFIYWNYYMFNLWIK